MYGAAAYGAFPYGSSGGVEPIDYEAMLSGGDELVFTARLVLRDIAGDVEEVRYYASAEWATTPTEVPASLPFEDRLTSYSFGRSIVNDRIGGLARGQGQVILNNADGALDDIGIDYAVDGREIEIRVGRLADPWWQHLVILKGVMVDAVTTEQALTISIEDATFKLDVPALPDLYAGTGDEEGGSDLEGKRKPLAYGQCFGVPGVLVDGSNLVYQFSNRPMPEQANYVIYSYGVGGNSTQGLQVFDRGAQLGSGSTNYADYDALVAASITAGDSAISRPAGMYRLGAAPDGFIFATLGSTDDDDAASIVTDLLERSAGITGADLDNASFDALTIDQPAHCGIWLGPDNASTLEDAIDEIVTGIGAWLACGRDGLMGVGVFTAPSGTPEMYFDYDEGDVFSLEGEPLPSGIWPPPWRVRVGYANVEQTFDDFAGAVSSLTTRMTSAYTIQSDEDPAVLDDHLRAQDWPPIKSRLTKESEAAAEAARVLALYSSGYRLYRMALDRRALLLKIGSLIQVTHPRFGLSSGSLMRVCAIDDRVDLTDGGDVPQVELVAFG